MMEQLVTKSKLEPMLEELREGIAAEISNAVVALTTTLTERLSKSTRDYDAIVQKRFTKVESDVQALFREEDSNHN